MFPSYTHGLLCSRAQMQCPTWDLNLKTSRPSSLISNTVPIKSAPLPHSLPDGPQLHVLLMDPSLRQFLHSGSCASCSGSRSLGNCGTGVASHTICQQSTFFLTAHSEHIACLNSIEVACGWFVCIEFHNIFFVLVWFPDLSAKHFLVFVLNFTTFLCFGLVR